MQKSRIPVFKSYSFFAIVICLLVSGILCAGKISAQIKEPAKPKASPTPTKKKTTTTSKGTASAKTTAAKTTAAQAKATPAPATTKTTLPTPPKPKADGVQISSAQVIASVAAARIRTQPNTGAPEVRRAKLGALYKVIEEGDGWYKVQVANSPKNVTGWISNQVASDYDSAKKEEIYNRIADKNFKADGMSFVNASELYEFITKIQPEVKGEKSAADLGLKRLLALSQALKAIPFDKDKEKPYKDFLKSAEKDVVYSEPAGQYFVVSERFWALHKRYPNAANADDIAWAGASNPLPGECEGYVVCMLYVLRATEGEYLDQRPTGKNALTALKNIGLSLEAVVADLKDKTTYYGPTDVTDRAEFNKILSELRGIVSRLLTAEADKQKVLLQLNQIAEAYR